MDAIQFACALFEFSFHRANPKPAFAIDGAVIAAMIGLFLVNIQEPAPFAGGEVEPSQSALHAKQERILFFDDQGNTVWNFPRIYLRCTRIKLKEKLFFDID